MIIINKDKNKDTKEVVTITTDVKKTLQTFKDLYSYPNNSDVTYRTWTIPGIEKQATIFYIKTIVDETTINRSIMQPLLMNEAETLDLKEYLTASDITTDNDIQTIAQKINNGFAALFIDGDACAYIISCNKFEGRNIESAENEIVLKGPKETFVENVDTNISLVRKNIRNENLIFESMQVSKRSKDEVYIGYIKDLAEESLLKEIKKE